jgi:hypothetical protein
MTQVYFANNFFSGNFGGPQFEAVCGSCQRVFQTGLPVSFSGDSNLSLQDNVTICPACSSPAKLESGTFEFIEATVETLKGANLTRQQIRRFSHKLAKTDDLRNLEFASRFINPALAKATNAAIQQEDANNAIEVVRKVAKICFLVTSAALALGAGVITADDIRDRYMAGELFEKFPETDSDNIEENFDEETNQERQDQGSDKPPWGDKGATEV